MKSVIKYHYPDSFRDALELTMSRPGYFIPVAGGTALALKKSSKPVELVDINRIGIVKISPERGELVIGAAAKISSLAASVHCQELYNGIIAKTAMSIGSTLIRNMVTLGGNTVAVFPWSDFPVTLLSLDARFEVHGKNKNIIGADDFFSKDPAKLFKEGELLKEISIPLKQEKHGASFIKFSRTKVDYSLASVAVFLSFSGSEVAESRIVFGGLKKLPFRVAEIENFIKGKSINATLLNEVKKICINKLNPLKDMRCSGDYKKELASVLVTRAIARVNDSLHLIPYETDSDVI